MLPLASHLEIRRAGTAAHQEALAIAELPCTAPRYIPGSQRNRSEHAEAVTILLFAMLIASRPASVTNSAR